MDYGSKQKTMIRSIITVAVGLIVASVPATSALAEATAFINVNVIRMTQDRVEPGRTVIVEDGLITVIGPVDVVPLAKGTAIIDGTDRYLLPGLTEMHAHIPDAESPELGRVMALFAANGVTTVRGMLGRSSHLRLREELFRGDTFGPRLVTSGPSLNGDSVRGADDGARQVREQYEAGYDFVKIHPGLNADEYAAIADVANELGIPFGGHVPADVGVVGALAAGMSTIDHLDGYLAALMPPDSDESGGYGGFFDVLLAEQVVAERIDELAMQTAASETWNVPTESLFEHRVSDVTVAELSRQPEMLYMPRATVQQWAQSKQRQKNERGFDPDVAKRAIEVRRMLIKALHDAGAGLLLGSDAPQVFNVPGFSLHHELQFLVDAGLTPFEALATGTTAVAEFFKTNTGSIAVGRDADLILLDSNPLADISNTRRIHGVMLRGTWHSATDLKSRLASYRAKKD
jgi:imidazolonepropionase-like amidohydrolase